MLKSGEGRTLRTPQNPNLLKVMTPKFANEPVTPVVVLPSGRPPLVIGGWLPSESRAGADAPLCHDTTAASGGGRVLRLARDFAPPAQIPTGGHPRKPLLINTFYSEF